MRTRLHMKAKQKEQYNMGLCKEVLYNRYMHFTSQTVTEHILIKKV